jgi:hypothetical protein
MIRVPLPSLQSLNKGANLSLKVLLVLWAALALSTIFVMTLGTDEAWVLNGLRSLLHPNVPNLSSELIVTSGGPFALVNLGLEALGSQLWAHRLVSALAMGGAFLLVLFHGPSSSSTTGARLLGLSVLLLVPGLAEVGTAALGTSVGLFLMLSSAVVWSSGSMTTWVRVLAGGALYGLAAASRFDLVLFGPAVLLTASLRTSEPRNLIVKFDGPAWLFLGIGIAIFLGNAMIMSLATNAMAPEVVGKVTGVSSWSFDYPKLLNRWVTLGDFAPPALLAALAITGIWAIKSRTVPASRGRAVSIEILLVVTSMLLLMGWLVRAPIPHLRYALPALFCLAAVGALALQRLAASLLQSGSAGRLLACQCFCIACAIGGIGTLTRSVVLSDSDYASWEWSHEMAHDYFRRFEAQADQRRIVAYVRGSIDPAARVYSTAPFPIRYLAGRSIVDLSQLHLHPTTSRTLYPKRVLILTPAMGTYFYLRPEAASWLHENARLITQIGRYSVYELQAGTDEDMQDLAIDRSNYRGHPDSRPWFGRS